MSRSKTKNNDSRLNKTLKITGIIFVISAILALVIFGKRLISINNSTSNEPVHVIQVVATNNYLKNIGDVVELKLSIDGQDVANR